MEYTDLIIIGAGPAGLGAGIYAGYCGLKAIIFEENTSAGLAAEIPLLENYPGFYEGISSRALIEKIVEHPKMLGVPGENELCGRGVSFCPLDLGRC